MFASLTGPVNLAGSWSGIQSALSSALGVLVTLFTIIGAILVIGSILGYIWERRRGSGNHSKLIHTLILGAILASPGLLIPLFLTIADFVANFVATLLKAGHA